MEYGRVILAHPVYISIAMNELKQNKRVRNRFYR